MKWNLAVLMAACCMFLYCDTPAGVKSTGPENVLIRGEFLDDTTYLIVCRGFPEQGLVGLQRIESSKRAALLNAYYFIRGTFGDKVAPDREGRVDKFKIMADYAVVYYIVKKNGLKALAQEAAVPPGPGE